MSVAVPPVQPASAAGYEPVSSFGAVLIGLLAPWMTLHLAWLLDSVGVVVDPIYTVIQDVGEDDGVTPTIGTYFNGELVTEGFQPGFGSLLNPQACPDGDLPFLAQFPGVQLPVGATPDEARSLLLAEGGLNRGTDAAVVAAAKRYLTGTQSVTLLPRTYTDGTPCAGWFVLVVRSDEISSGTTWAGGTYSWSSATGPWNGSDNQAALIAAVDAVKFGGLMWSLIVSNGYVWTDATKTWATEGSLTWKATAVTAP